MFKRSRATNKDTYFSIEDAIETLKKYWREEVAEYLIGILQEEIDNPSWKNYLKVRPIKYSKDWIPFEYINIEEWVVTKKLIHAQTKTRYIWHIDTPSNQHK